MVVCSGSTPDDGRVIFIGIGMDELRMLVAGGAIEIDLKQQGLNGQILMFGGANNEDLLATMKPMMSEHTKIIEQDAPIYGLGDEPKH